MKQEITFSPNCVFISDHNEEVLEELITDLFVAYVNEKYGKQVLERIPKKLHKGDSTFNETKTKINHRKYHNQY